MKATLAFPAIVIGLILIATSSAVLYQTDEPHRSLVTARGQLSTIQGSGLYRFDDVQVARAGLVWDIVNLTIGVPAIVASLFLTSRGSLRGRLIVAGLMAYFFYVYLMYAVMLAFNPMFPVYVAILGCSAIGLFLNLGAVDFRDLSGRISPKFPRRLYFGYTVLIAAILVAFWSRLIVSVTTSGLFDDAMDGISTLEMQALDLGMVVPLALTSGYLVMKRSPWGYILAAVTVTFAAVMLITLTTWIASPFVKDDGIDPLTGAPFLVVAAASFAMALVFYRAVGAPAPATPAESLE
ncbi:MAG: hypothetical protein FJ319_04720 [SAR202 cluster bacterium]|nr:hypothetical protein [SAR202 cluster bacterium]